MVTAVLAACGAGNSSRTPVGGDGNSSASSTSSSSAQSTSFVYGADVGWVTQEEASGLKFYSSSNVQTDPYVLLKNLGIDTIRLRVWVNPDGGWNGKADVLAKAKRAAAQGQRIVIDFHYSDAWADPGHQTKPAAWTNDSFATLQSDVYTHTYDVLNYLKTNGITVSWVQVGNEIASGLLWPDGDYNHFSNMAALTNQGYYAVKAVYPNAKVIIHVGGGQDDGLYRWFFDNFTAAGGLFDVIGMSYYPTDWNTTNPQIAATIQDMASRYGKPSMVMETGYAYNDPKNANAMISDLIWRLKQLGGNGLGVLYWEPEAYPGWNGGYSMGALTSKGSFTSAMDAFKH